MTYEYTSAETCNAGVLGPTLPELCSTSTYLTFMTLLNAYFRTSPQIGDVCGRVSSVETLNDTYDYIVVGGGAGGAVVASRLSEDSDVSVLLLEAGPDEPIAAQVPGFVFAVIGSDIEWGYETITEENACLSTDGVCTVLGGKVLGGNTVQNGMIYLRGNPTDYAKWVELGAEGWSYDEVLPYFLKGEDNGEIDRVGTAYHATGGPMSVERFPYQPPFAAAILNASVEAGFGVVEDLNGAHHTGFTIGQASTKKGVRRSSAAAYLRPVRHRSNLHISLNSTVTRVLIENNATYGVEYYKDGELKTTNISREVILSAGALKTPFILKHSGIGPKDELENYGITVVQDLPGVGENFHDHPTFPVTFTIDEDNEYDDSWAAAAEYLTFQTGPLSSTGLTQVVGVLANNDTTDEWPNIQLNPAGYQSGCAPGEIDALKTSGQRTVDISVAWQHPISRGNITLASSNVTDKPVFWGNFLGEQEDVDGLVSGINLALKLADTDALKAWNFTLSTTTLSGCADYDYPSDEYWACAVKYDTAFGHHYCGTAKMGNASDSMAVVDTQLRVFGISGLRVADASIMPQVTSNNIAAPVMMIGERAADFIKKTWA